MIFSIGSLARARVVLFSVQTSNQFYRFPRTRGDRPRVCPIYLRPMDLGLIVDPEASEANQGRPDGTARPAGEKVSVVGVISL